MDEVLMYRDKANRKFHYLYILWASIKQRCFDPNWHSYHNYGGRGIRMRKEWINDYALFYTEMLLTLGDRPEGWTLDRIDNDAGYYLWNLRWATYTQQNNNKRPISLTKEDAKEIKHLLSLGKFTQTVIAKNYNTDQGTVSRIKNNKRFVACAL